MLSEMEKQITSLSSSTNGRISASACSSPGAEVFGVVLCASDHAKISSGVIVFPSSYSSSPNRICKGRMEISYFLINSSERSHVLSAIIFTIIYSFFSFLLRSLYLQNAYPASLLFQNTCKLPDTTRKFAGFKSHDRKRDKCGLPSRDLNRKLCLCNRFSIPGIILFSNIH